MQLFFQVAMLTVIAPFLNYLLHVFGYGRLKENFLLGYGMYEPQCLGMQGTAVADAETIVYKLLVFGIDGPFQNFITSIFPVVEQSVPNMLHVHPNLVGSAGFQDTFHQGNIVEPLQYFIVGDGVFAGFSIGIGIKHFTEIPVPGYMCINCSLVFLHIAPDQRHIFSFYRVAEELFGQMGCGFPRFGNHNQTSGVFIDAVYQSESGQVFFVDGRILLTEVIGNPVQQRTAEIAHTGMNHHIGGFVDDHQGCILVHNIQGDIFLFQDGMVGVDQAHDHNFVARLNLIVAFNRLSVHGKKPGFDALLYFIPGRPLHVHLHPFVYPKRLLAPVYYKCFFLIKVLGLFLGVQFCVYLHTAKVLYFRAMQQQVLFEDMGVRQYKAVWDYQEHLLKQNADIKLLFRFSNEIKAPESELPTSSHLLFVEHPPVYTLGKNGKEEHVLISEQERKEKGIEYYHINRGGDITFHGPGQLVGYPILDLEKFKTDLGWYLRTLEEVIIQTMAEYGLKGERSAGETGVWMDANIKGKERKICAMGIKCSRWITMHGFAFNVNTNLDYFNHIVPCGIANKAVTSLQQELGHPVDMEEVKYRVKKNFEQLFGCVLISH